MTTQGRYETPTNPWAARAAKFLVMLCTAVVILATAWADGPTWLYPVAASVGAVIGYWVPNAPKYSDPRQRNLR